MNLRQLLNGLWKTSPQINYLALLKKISTRSKSRSQSLSQSNVFVLSTGRTGTMTLAGILALTDEYLVFHEPSPKLFGLSKLCYTKGSREDLLEIFGEAFLTAREYFLNLSVELGKNYIETSPQITFLAGAIRKVLPDTKFIHIVRDPRTGVRTAMRRNWYGGNPYDKFRILPDEDHRYHNIWREMTVFQKNIWLWTETNRWILNFTGTLSEGKSLLIKAEDLFSAKEAMLRRLFGFIDASPPPEKKIIQIIRKKLNAQVNGHFPEPTRWTPEMHNQMNQIAGTIATKLGYAL